jgi:hypothetical protein
MEVSVQLHPLGCYVPVGRIINTLWVGCWASPIPGLDTENPNKLTRVFSENRIPADRFVPPVTVTVLTELFPHNCATVLIRTLIGPLRSTRGWEVIS